MTDRFFHRAALAHPAESNRWLSVRERQREQRVPLIFSGRPCLSRPWTPREWALAAIPPPSVRLRLAPAQGWAAVAPPQAARQPLAGSPPLESPARQLDAKHRRRYSNG